MVDDMDSGQLRKDRKYFAELLRETGELPGAYGRTVVTLVPVDPYLVHVYWEVSSMDREKGRVWSDRSKEGYQPVLRFYDVTYIEFDGANAHGYFDVEVDMRMASWYVHLWSPEKSYVVDLGLRAESGEFYRLARSSSAQTPPAWPSPKADDHAVHPRTNVAPAPAPQHPGTNPVMTAASVLARLEEGAQRPSASGEHQTSGRIQAPGNFPEKETRATDVPQAVDAALSLDKFYAELRPYLMQDRPPLTPEERATLKALKAAFDLTDVCEHQLQTESLASVSSPGRWWTGGSR